MTKFYCLAVCLLGYAATASAAPFTNGSLSGDIRADNGAIDTITFGGSDFFNPGTPVSDFGFQNGSSTGTFVLNNTSGGAGQAVAVSGSNVVTGTYTGGGANVAFSRSYSLVAGLNVISVSTTFTNNGPGATTISAFDTFDPDQGIDQALGFGTFNDVFSLAGGTVGQASISSGLTVIAGSLDPRAAVAAGSPFSIGSGTALNSFFAAPFDGNGAFADQGLHIGLQALLGSGQSTTFTYFLAFGLTPQDAQNAFVLATPEPASMLAWGLITGVGLVGYRLRRRKVTA